MLPGLLALTAGPRAGGTEPGPGGLPVTGPATGTATVGPAGGRAD